MWKGSFFNIGPESEEFNTVSFVRGLNQKNPAQGWTVCVRPYLKLEFYETALLQNINTYLYVHIFGIC